MIWASCWFNRYELGYLPVLNPGGCGGRTWFIEYTGDVHIMLVIEAMTAYDALIVLSNDPEWGDSITVCPVEYDDPDNDAGKILSTQYVRVHGQADSDPPYPVRYHGEGYPERGMDPRQFAAWEWN